MSTQTTTTPPPLLPDTQPQPGGIVAVRIVMPLCFWIRKGALVNLWSTNFLAEAIKLKLGSESNYVSGGGAGLIEDSHFCFSVHRLGPALITLDDLLTRLAIRPFATLLFFHGKLGDFRIHGENGAGLIFDGFTFDKFLGEMAKAEAYYEKWLAVMRGQTPPTDEPLWPDNPPPAAPAP